MNSDDQSDLAERVKRLGQEKSYLQLIFTMISRVVSVSGLENVSENLLKCIVDCIGGTNLILYYRVDDDIYSVDICGARRLLDRIDDELVSRVFESRQPHELEHDFRDTRMTTPEFTKAYTWTYPLLVGADIIGVCKVEGLHIGMRELCRQLPTFFACVAMVLKNEIRSETRLQKALDEVTHEVEERRRVEEDLRRSRETLEERVLERTAELRCSEEKYRRIVETANEGILAMDREHRTTFVNEKLAEMLGYRSDEMLGHPVVDFIFPEEMDDHLSGMTMRQMGGSESCERRFRRKDGGECWFSVSATALDDEQGSFVGSFAMFSDITERRRAKEALQESESAMRAVLEAVTESVYLMDADGTVVIANKTMAERLGRPVDEMAGCCVYDLLSPSVAEGRREQVDKVIRTGRHVKFVDERRGRWIENSLYPIFDSQGRVFRLAVFGRDVTDKKLAEESQKKSEALLSVTQGMTKVGGWEWDVVNRTMTWTDEVYRIHEFSRTDCREADEALICRSLACYAPEERDAVEDAFRRCVSSGEPYDRECSFTTAKGRRLWVRTRAHAEWQWGKVVRVIGTIMDITDRKQMELALRESEGRLRSIFLAAPVGIGLTCDRILSDVNDTLCRMTGYAREELVGKSARMLYPDDTEYEFVGREKYKQITERGTGTVETRWVRKDGSVITIILSSTPFYPGEYSRGVTFTALDITELRNSIQEKDVLLREVHHRVKNNLAAIIALLEMQQKGIGDSKAAASLQELAVRIKSMALVHEKLYRSDNLARIDFQDYLEPLTSHLQTTFGVSDIVRCHIDATGVEFGLDEAIPCALIINELVTNAMKHAFPMGKPGHGFETCDIRTTVKMEGDECTLSVADNGIGLPPDLDWRSCSSLGLRLVRMLGEHQLGGHILLDQTEGTCFILRFISRRGR
jgi:PAS domain S-box-containing protein